MSNLRVGIIGIGFFAATAHVPHLLSTGKAEVVAISRRNAERLAMIQQELKIAEAYTDWRELLDKSSLDAAIISTPHHAHTEPTIAALERGLHVLVEKPIALTVEDTSAMIEAANKAHRTLMVGYHIRAQAQWRSAVQAIRAGAIGTIRQISAVCGMDTRFFWDNGASLNQAVRGMLDLPGATGVMIRDLMAPGNWRSTPDEMGGGMFVDSGSHTLDVLFWLADAGPVEVVAMAEKAGGPVDNFMTVQSRLDNGILLSLSLGASIDGGEIPLYGRSKLTVHGDRGILEAQWPGFNPAEAEIWIEALGVRQKVEPDFPNTTPAAAFVDTILNGAPNLCPPQEAARVVALTQAAYRSADEKRIIHIDPA